MGHKKGDPGQKAMASYMKERGITRTSSACPWHCGARVSNGGGPLLMHLNNCIGGAAAKRQRG